MPAHKKGINKNKSWYALSASNLEARRQVDARNAELEQAKAEKIKTLRHEQREERTKELQFALLQEQVRGGAPDEGAEELLAKRKRVDFLAEQPAQPSAALSTIIRAEAEGPPRGDQVKAGGITGRVSKEEAAAARKAKDDAAKAKHDPLERVLRAQNEQVALAAKQLLQPRSPHQQSSGESAMPTTAPQASVDDVATVPAAAPNKARLLEAIAKMRKF